MFNQFIVIGRVVRDHEVQTLPNGTKVLNFTIAQNKKWKNAQGEQVEKPAYFEMTIFWKGAEIVAQYSRKWSKMMVSWDMENNNHEKEKDGIVIKTYGFRFTVKNFEFLDPTKKDDNHEQEHADWGPTTW